MEENLILTIDLGTSGPKVALYRHDGTFIDYSFEKNDVILKENGGAEQDTQQWWTTIRKAWFNLLDKTGIHPSKVGFIGVTGQWSGTVAVNKEGVPIMNAINWMDARGHQEIMKLYDGVIKIQGYGVTKVLNWLRICNGIAGKSGKDPLAHILYLKKNEPEAYNATYKFLEPIDYLTYRFTGKMLASYHTITLHWLTDNRDINNVKYHEPFLKETGIDRAKLPDLIPAGSIIGTIQKEVALEFQLNENVQVITASSDVMSAAVGSGAIKNGEPHVYIGTSGWLICHLQNKKIDIDSSMATLPSAMPGVYLLANEQENAGNCINFLRDHILYPNDAFHSGEVPADFYLRLNQAAASVPAGSENLIFFPWLYGERSPVEDHSLRGGFFNLGLNHKRAHMVRAVMEGVCYNSKWLFHKVEKNAAKKFDYIHIIGGGAQSDIWCQTMADVLNCKVRKVKNPIMANTQGVAFLCMMAQGKINREEISKINFIEKEFMPIQKNVVVYERLFKVFVSYYKKNKAFFKLLNEQH